MRQFILAGVCLTAFAASVPAALAADPHNTPAGGGSNILVNGSFETGDFTGWTGSLVADTGNNSINEDLGYGLAEDGSFYLSFGSASLETLSQTFSVVAGQNYVVSGWFAGDGEFGATAIVNVPGGLNAGIVLDPIDDTTYPAYQYHQFVFRAASSGVAELDINLMDPGSFGSADNFSATTYTPEPADLAIFGVGLLGLIALRRRRA